ncbi:MAG: histidinol-phosphate transaminase [Spirochaetes bacterium]|nr:histidinol-phosphate transaminase [Spirochaetota bacterium]
MKFWNKNLRNMAEYIPGEQPQNLDEYIKLNTNENPFPPSKAVIEAIKNACDDNLRRYPNPTAVAVGQCFAQMHSLTVDHVFVGNGSDEIFTLIFRGFIESKERAAFPYPSYSLYYTLAEANGIPYDKITLTKSLDVDFEKFLEKNYALIIVANPNNPTGKKINKKDARSFLEKFKGLLVIDEAYVDFYGETLIDFVKEFDNCIITRSLSKSYSLAGLRVGFAIAHPDIIRGFIKLKDSYNVSRLAQAGALAALQDVKGFRYSIQMVRNNKEYLEEMLENLGFETIPSHANFVFTKHPKVSSKELYEKLKERKILVRWFEGPIQSEYLRISVGTMMEIKALVKELRELVER